MRNVALALLLCCTEWAPLACSQVDQGQDIALDIQFAKSTANNDGTEVRHFTVRYSRAWTNGRDLRVQVLCRPARVDCAPSPNGKISDASNEADVPWQLAISKEDPPRLASIETSLYYKERHAGDTDSALKTFQRVIDISIVSEQPQFEITESSQQHATGGSSRELQADLKSKSGLLLKPGIDLAVELSIPDKCAYFEPVDPRGDNTTKTVMIPGGDMKSNKVTIRFGTWASAGCTVVADRPVGSRNEEWPESITLRHASVLQVDPQTFWKYAVCVIGAFIAYLFASIARLFVGKSLRQAFLSDHWADGDHQQRSYPLLEAAVLGVFACVVIFTLGATDQFGVKLDPSRFQGFLYVGIFFGFMPLGTAINLIKKTT